MIKFQRVRYKNILSTGDNWSSIQLDANPETLIVGHNGAGKSTLLDALCFVLFDKPFRKITKGRLVNSINGKGLLVEVNFSIGDTEYMIRRGYKPNKFEVYRDGELVDQDGSNRDYQSYLEKNILKLNFKSFTQVVILGSSTFVPFMELSAADRRAIVEDLLDIEIFSRMNILAKGRLSNLKNDVLDLQGQAQVISEKLNLYRENLVAIEAEKKERMDDTAERSKKISQDATQRISEVSEKTHNQIMELNKENENLATQITELTAKADEVRAKISKAADIRLLHDKLNASINEEKALMRPHQETLDFFVDKDTCPTCTQDIDATFKKNITETNQEAIKKLLANIEKHVEKLEVVNEKLALVDKALAIIAKYDADISIANNKVSSNNSNIQSLQREERSTIEAIQRGAKTAIDDLTAEAEKAADTTKVDEARKRVDETAGQEAHIKEQEAKSKVALKAHEVVVNLLKDSGIKTQIIKQYLPIMNKYINEYMEKMNFPAAFELDDEFNEKIRSRFRDDFNYANFSEGEKQRINLSLLLTWRKIAIMRNSAATNLLVLDEVFDSSLDDDGTEGFMQILKSLGEEANVFVISHKGDSLFERFNNVMEFYKDGDFSKMKEKMD